MFKRKLLWLSLLISTTTLVILVSLTTAYFSDLVVTSNNIIKTGRLEVLVEESLDNSEGSFTSIKNKTLFLEDDLLWQPATYTYRYIKVSNVGSLALNYKLSLEKIAQEEKALDKQIQVYFIEDLNIIDLNNFIIENNINPKYLSDLLSDEDSYLTLDTNLKPKESKTYLLMLYMKDDANNTYQEMATSAFSLNVYASQLTDASLAR